MPTNEPGGITPSAVAEHLSQLSPSQVAGLRGFENLLRAKLCPPLNAGDVVGVLMLTVRPVFERRILTRGKPANAREFVHCERLALLTTLAACPAIAIEAGVIAKVWLPPRALVARINYWWMCWRAELQEITGEAARNVWYPSTDPRRAVLYQLWRIVTDAKEIDGKALLADVRAGWRAALGRSLKKDERDPVGLAARAHEAAGAQGLFDLTFVGADGSFHFGKRQIRDGLRTEVRRERERAQRARPLEVPTGREQADARSFESGMSAPPDGAEAVASADEVAHAIVAIEVVLAVRLARAKRGGVDWHLLSNFRELAVGSLTPTQLAERVGASKSWFCERWTNIRADVSREVTGK